MTRQQRCSLGFFFTHSRDHISIYTVNGEPLFFQHFDEAFFPTLRVLHKCACSLVNHSPPLGWTCSSWTFPRAFCLRLDPYILPAVKIDRGAIRFVLAGAQIMCPGLTSKGGELPPAEAALEAGTPVAVFAEGKEHAVAVGITKMGTEEMKKTNKGVGVETTTYLGDDLWALKTL